MTLCADTAVVLWVPSRMVRGVISLEQSSEKKVSFRVRFCFFSYDSKWLRMFLTAMPVASSANKNCLYR